MAENVGGIYYDVTADTSKLVGQTRVVERETGKMAGEFNKITKAIKLYAAALAIVKSAQMADDMRLLAARVQVAAGSIESAGVAMAQLQAISTRTQTALAANVQVFTRLNASLRQMGGTQDDTLRVTELLGMAIKVSGASAAEASSAMTQFGQALGSGKLAGDELRSLLENAPYLMQQLADGMGVPIGALKSLGEQGKLTADAVVRALQKAAGTIKGDFDKLPQTLSGAFAVMLDAAARANEKLDDLTGVSAALTGATRGLSEVLDKLALSFAASNEQAGAMATNTAVKSWAETTRTVLSYVADAADVTWQTLSTLGRNVAFVFTSIGAEIGGIGAQVAAVLRGDFNGARAIGAAMKSDSEQRRRELDASDAKMLAARQTWGQQMRQAWEQGAGGGRGFVNPAPVASKLKATGGDGGKKDKFDDAAYLAGLAQQTAEGLEKVRLVEQEALRKNAKMLQDGLISRETAAKASVLIEANARDERIGIQLGEAEERRQMIIKRSEDEAAAIVKAKDRLAFANAAIAAGDPVMQLELELKAKSDKLAEYAALDMENAQIYAEAQVALERDTQAKIADIIARRQSDQLAAQAAMLGNYGSLFGSLAEVTKQFEGEQSSAYRAMFAVSKAFAIADAIVKIQQGVANAMSLPYPANIAAAASTAAAAAGIVGTIKGAQFGGGRQYGGPAVGGSLYRVNEAGAPEMFTAANGAQYMMPTRDGRVTAADKVGGGGVTVQVINNHPTARIETSSDDRGQVVRIAVNEVAQQISGHSGPVWQALRGSTNVTPRL